MINIFIKENIPSKLEESLLHKNICNKLILIKKHNFPNLLFYGYEGKTILIKLFLLKLFNKIFLKNTTEYNINYNFSNYHIEINVKENIKNINQNISIFINNYKSNKSIINLPYKLVVIYYFDLLEVKTQQELRRIFEAWNLRIILHSSKINKVIAPLISRFLLIRVPCINHSDAIIFYKYLSKKYNFRLIKLDNYIKLASFNNILSIKKIKFIFYMKLLSKENKIQCNIEFDNETILNEFTSELSKIGTIEPFIIMNNCISLLTNYLKKKYNINNFYSHILIYICKIDIPDEQKLKIIKLISYMESNKHSRKVITLESTIAQLIDCLNKI